MHPKNQLEKLIQLGIKQDEIAKAFNIAQSTISRILSGDIEKPNWLIASQINEMYLKEIENAKTQ